MPASAFTLAMTAAVLSLPVALAILPDPAAQLAPAETVTIDVGRVAFPAPGEFSRAGRSVTAKAEDVEVPPFAVMRYQVSRADYGRCVSAGACAQVRDAGPADAPVTGVSFLDAEAYAAWYSRVTGETWRLPTALEARAMAAERFAGDSAALPDDPANPAARWLRVYRAEAAAARAPDPRPKPRGHYGTNSLGVADFGGNVWEWTATCYRRVTLDGGGRTLHVTENCGVRVIEGRHRSYMTDFIRDPKSGGCAVGTPPDNLGFRLVREAPLFPALAWIKRRIAGLSA